MQDLGEAFTTALQLIGSLDPGLLEIVVLSLQVSLTAVAIAGSVGLLGRAADGTSFSNVTAPFVTAMNVGNQLAYRAMTRAIGEIEPGGVTANHLSGRSAGSKILAVNLQQETFALPAGWKISRITDDIVRLMLGRPMLCNKSTAETMGPGDIRGVIGDNSCVKARLEDLLQAKAIP